MFGEHHCSTLMGCMVFFLQRMTQLVGDNGSVNNIEPTSLEDAWNKNKDIIYIHLFIERDTHWTVRKKWEGCRCFILATGQMLFFFLLWKKKYHDKDEICRSSPFLFDHFQTHWSNCESQPVIKTLEGQTSVCRYETETKKKKKRKNKTKAFAYQRYSLPKEYRLP